MTWEIMVGLETHIELDTRTKLFCGCSTAFGAPPNSQCCPVCLGLPGALPVLNGAAVDSAVRAGLALGCTISRLTRFDRKNYFYPDLPKAYQITQFYDPVARHGALELRMGKRIRIAEMHLEEDAGKLRHEGAETGIDYNRCGVPLVEIVTEPDFRTADEVIDYLERLKRLFQYLEVSQCKMQEGSLRCDVNLSVRPVGVQTLGTRTEMKNLGSFRAIFRAISVESARQIALLERGESVIQETRRWDETENTSIAMRVKEEPRDYGYFPEPDLPPQSLPRAYVEGLRATLPELAPRRAIRFQQEYALTEYAAETLTGQKDLADFFERVVALGASPLETAHWMIGQVLRKLSEGAIGIKEMHLTPKTLAKLILMVQDGRLNRNTAIQVLDAVFDTDGDPEAYALAHGLEQISDAALIGDAAEAVLAAHPKSVLDYHGGKEKAFGFLVGQVMRQLGGKASPEVVNQVLREQLDKDEN